MKNFSIFSKCFFLAFGLLLLCGCEAIQDVLLTDPPRETEAAPLRVTMIYPSDCVGSAAYCDAFHTGVKAAEAEPGIRLTEVNGMEDNLEASKMLFREVAQNSDLVLTAGYQMGEPLTIVAPEFPDVKFAIFDVVLDIPNVASVNYKSNEGSFLVGAIAALKTESGKIGYIGGVDVPLLREFEAGYVAGIQAINPDAEILVEYISESVAGFGQPDRAKELALAQYESGIDVIYVAAGGSVKACLKPHKNNKNLLSGLTPMATILPQALS